MLALLPTQRSHSRCEPLLLHSRIGAPLLRLVSAALIIAATCAQSVLNVRPGNVSNGDYFGATTALNDAGTLLAIGALGRGGTGAIFTFTCGGVNCTPASPASFSPSGAVSGEGFATSLAMSSSGTTIVAGSPNRASYAGIAYVFTCSVSTGVCGSQVTLVAPAAGSFGTSVAVNGDGSYVAVGAVIVASIYGAIGAVYTYACSVGSCSLQQTLQPSGAALNANVGYGMAWSADTSTLVVSSRNFTVGKIGAAEHTRKAITVKCLVPAGVLRLRVWLSLKPV